MKEHQPCVIKGQSRFDPRPYTYAYTLARTRNNMVADHAFYAQ